MLTQTCRQWNKSKDPNMSTHNYNHLIFNKDAKNILEKRQHQTNGAGKTRCSYVRKMKLDPTLSPCTKTNSKCMKDLSLEPEALKLLEENAGCQYHTWYREGGTSCQELRPTADKWDFLKRKCLCTAKETTNWVRRKPTEWEDFCQLSDRLKTHNSQSCLERSIMILLPLRTAIGLDAVPNGNAILPSLLPLHLRYPQ